jgi:hypothetical protein
MTSRTHTPNFSGSDRSSFVRRSRTLLHLMGILTTMASRFLKSMTGTGTWAMSERNWVSPEMSAVASRRT